MKIYIETNFVLELTFEQEQCKSCESILEACEAKDVELIIPAYSLAEPHEKLIRQARDRRGLRQSLEIELRQLSRNSSYRQRIQSIQDISSLILQSNEEEKQRFSYYRERILEAGNIISLTSEILCQAALYEVDCNLSPQDALVYASVMSHLENDSQKVSCFLNRNFKDFDSPDITEVLKSLNCVMIPNFNNGYKFIQSRLSESLRE